MPNSKTREQIKRFFREREREMIRLLEDMVRIQSGSYNKEGVDRMGRLIASLFQESGVSRRVVKQPTLGDHLIVRTHGERSFKKQILMVGHMDTVFPADTAFNWFREEEGRCFGPGVVDMKGGLVAGVFAIRALDHAGLLAEMPITFVFNSDEEIGSGSSEALIREEARKSAFAFVLECGGLAGEVVTGRKGSLTIDLEIRGRAGHAAFAGPDKGSAILELARKTLLFEALNDPARGVSANVGAIEGGIGPNTVPDLAAAKIDFRFPTPVDEAFLHEKIEAITAEQTTPNTRASWQIRTRRSAMPSSEANKRLFEVIEESARMLNVPVIKQFRQGVSDANLIAEENIPVIDGLGPIGARDHSEDEYMITESLPLRAMLLAFALADCWEKHQNNMNHNSLDA